MKLKLVLMHVDFEAFLGHVTETNQSSGEKLGTAIETWCLTLVNSVGVKNIVLKVCNVREEGGRSIWLIVKTIGFRIKHVCLQVSVITDSLCNLKP